jgi:hypothetical protein
LAVVMWSIWKHCNMKLWNNVTETERSRYWTEPVTFLRTGTLQSICKKTNNAAEAETDAVMPELQVQSISRRRLGCVGKNLKRVGTNVILMFRFQIIGTELVLVCVSVMMKAIACCLPKHSSSPILHCGFRRSIGTLPCSQMGSRVTATTIGLCA